MYEAVEWDIILFDYSVSWIINSITRTDFHSAAARVHETLNCIESQIIILSEGASVFALLIHAMLFRREVYL